MKNLELLFEKSRERERKKNERENRKLERGIKKKVKKVKITKKKENKKNEVITNKKEKKDNKPPRSEKMKRAANMTNVYRYNDTKDGFDEVCDFDAQWMIDNIYSKECIYCGETDWRLLGCDRINNNKGHTKDNVNPCCKRCNKLRSDKFTVAEMKEIGAVIKKIEGKRKNYSLRRSKRVASFDLEGNLIKEYPTVAQAQEDGYSRGVIWRACQRYEEGYTYRGLRWRYLD